MTETKRERYIRILEKRINEGAVDEFGTVAMLSVNAAKEIVELLKEGVKPHE